MTGSAYRLTSRREQAYARRSVGKHMKAENMGGRGGRVRSGGCEGVGGASSYC